MYIRGSTSEVIDEFCHFEVFYFQKSCKVSFLFTDQSWHYQATPEQNSGFGKPFILQNPLCTNFQNFRTFFHIPPIVSGKSTHIGLQINEICFFNQNFLPSRFDDFYDIVSYLLLYLRNSLLLLKKK